MIDYFRTIDELDKEEFNKEEKEESEEIYNRTVQHEPIDFGLGSVTYWGVSRFVFSVILAIGLFCSSCFLKNAMGQDLYSHMVMPMNIPESYVKPYEPLPLPYYNPCYHTEYDNFYLKQLYYDSVYNYIYNKTHTNKFTIQEN